MSLFKVGDPAGALEKTKQRIADVDRNIESLKVKRQELLAAPDVDNVTEIQTVDKGIEAENAAKLVYLAKASALQEEIRRGEYHTKEKQRKAAIEVITKKLARRARVAAELEAAIVLVGEKYFELTALPSLHADWPFSVAPDSQLDMKLVNREVGWAMYSASRPVGGKPTLPQANSLGLGVAGVNAAGVAEVVKKQSETIIASLEMADIHRELMTEVA